jgi:hypothetical protein
MSTSNARDIDNTVDRLLLQLLLLPLSLVKTSDFLLAILQNCQDGVLRVHLHFGTVADGDREK